MWERSRRRNSTTNSGCVWRTALVATISPCCGASGAHMGTCRNPAICLLCKRSSPGVCATCKGGADVGGDSVLARSIEEGGARRGRFEGAPVSRDAQSAVPMARPSCVSASSYVLRPQQQTPTAIHQHSLTSNQATSRTSHITHSHSRHHSIVCDLHTRQPRSSSLKPLTHHQTPLPARRDW